MKAVKQQLARAAVVLGLAFGLAACGGGGGGGGQSAEPLPAPTPDARNGTYTMVAADAREYSLALDFDARTYQVTGDGVARSGTFTEQGGQFFFQPANSIGATGTSTLRFTMATDAAVGEIDLPTGALPFVAARNYITTVAGAAGTYNMLGRRVGGPGAPVTTVQQGEITAGGQLRACDDAAVVELGNCPSSSVTSGTVTVSGTLFSAATSNGAVLFRVARVGADKLFLRASVSTGTTRRFVVGTPVTATFAGDTFVGGTTDPAWGTVQVTPTTFTSTATHPSGVTVTRTGSAAAASGIESLRRADVGADGIFFAARSFEIGVAAAAPDNLVHPGFMAIGRKQ